MRRKFLAGGMALVATALVGCTKAAEDKAVDEKTSGTGTTPEPAPQPAAKPVPVPPPAPPPAPPMPDTVTVSLTTTKGEIVIKLEARKAPITVGNFLKYLDSGKIDNSPFWRAADSGASGFVQATMNGPTFPPIAHEPTSQTGLSHTDGAISMSRFDPGTATADFVICVGDNTFMDAGREGSKDKLGYAAFGHVIKGMGVVRAILHGRIDTHTRKGGWAGQMLAKPVKITSAKRIG